MAQKILLEIAPLTEKDSLYIVERHKKEFTYPIHKHNCCELNFVRGGKGVERIVGDSVEKIGDLDLVLMTSDIEHVWQQGDCHAEDIQEITVQFDLSCLPEPLLKKNQFASMAQLIERAKKGVAFSQTAILNVYSLMMMLVSEENGFQQMLMFFEMVHRLSLDKESRVLSSGSFAQTSSPSGSRRVQKIKEFIDTHYKEDVTLGQLADLIGMTQVGCSRFFKTKTGRTITDYLTDIRLGHASRMLVDTTHSVAEVAYDCGFNNLSNFNRLFHRIRGVTPTQFRNAYQKNKILL
ncbi:MAG: AraC family transcriptional regulator [Paludibacteraceae bacterium]|nr:AraC family transcriptional regulator [Paludibacteraceae bacterium]